MSGKEWEIVTKWKLMWFFLGVGLFLHLVTKSEPGFIIILDHANLLFHEAGHFFVGLISQTLEVYGGTLGQLLFPTLLMISFWRKKHPISVAVSTIWFFENWLNIARYMADARALRLPLVGGDGHDWNTILGQWDLLVFDTRIAEAVTAVAWIGMTAACFGILYRAYVDRHRATVGESYPGFA